MLKGLSILIISSLFASVCLAAPRSTSSHLGVTEHLGASLDRSLPFMDSTGKAVQLGQYFSGDRPVVLALVYYTCPGLCSYQLAGMIGAMKSLPWTSGQDFETVFVSIDPQEDATVAASKKAVYLKTYGRPSARIHFLTGKKESIQKLADELGFHYKWLPQSKEYSHPTVSYVVNPSGKIFRYIYGAATDARTLRLALVDASGGKIGSVMDRILLYCFHFDSSKNRYTLDPWNLMGVAGGLTVASVALFGVPMLLKERSANRQPS